MSTRDLKHGIRDVHTTEARLTRVVQRGIAIAFVAVLLVPGAMAQELEATRAAGTGGVLSADGATLRFAPGGTFTADVALGQGEVIFVDEVVEQAIHPPGSDEATFGNPVRHETPQAAAGAFAYATTASDADAVLLVVPFDPAAHQSQAGTSADFTIGPSAAHAVEASHAQTPGTLGPRPFQYYEYAVPDSLRWHADGDTSVQVFGDFEVYLWGIPFTLSGPEGTAEHRTGYSSEPSASMGGLATDDHYRYVRMLVRGGSLTLAVTQDPVEIFAPSMESAPSEITFQGADGTIPAKEGSFSAEGAVTASEGTYRLDYRPGGMDIDVTKAPMGTSGPYVRFTPGPWHEKAWVIPGLSASILLVGLSATLYTYPTFSGNRHLRYMESLTGTPRAIGWRKSRAEGYALLAAAAEDAGHLRRAVLWMALASRLDPHDPGKRLDLAVFQAGRGRFHSALRHFKEAHSGFLEDGDLENMAHNAYEAARAAALVAEPAQAIDWLRIAVQSDAQVAKLIGVDPSFASLRGLDDYAALTEA